MISTPYFTGDERRARLLANLLFLPALSVGALQMFGIHAGAITNYGADLLGPIPLYAALRANATVLRRFIQRPLSPGASAAVVLAGCVAWEICQRFDLRGTPLAITIGRFDPLDILAYVAGVGIAFALDALLMRQSRISGEMNA